MLELGSGLSSFAFLSTSILCSTTSYTWLGLGSGLGSGLGLGLNMIFDTKSIRGSNSLVSGFGSIDFEYLSAIEPGAGFV